MRTRYHQFAPTHPPEYYDEDETMTYREAMRALNEAVYAAVRAYSGNAYPWPALDEAEAKALAALKGEGE